MQSGPKRPSGPNTSREEWKEDRGKDTRPATAEWPASLTNDQEKETPTGNRQIDGSLQVLG